MSTPKKYKPVDYYFIAAPSYWPLMGSIGAFSTVLGFIQVLHNSSWGVYIMLFGLVMLAATIFGWFGRVINESVEGLHSLQMDRTYRWGMLWFIVSEVALFGVFFIALFYIRVFSITELGGDPFELAKNLLLFRGDATHTYLWPNFQATWPLLVPPKPAMFTQALGVVETWKLPALNTLILLTSAVTVTWAHWGFKTGKQKQIITGLVITIILGLIFESVQVIEYHHAITELRLTLNSNIYGSIFYTITGLHAAHVSIGIIMLAVILIRCLRGHFRPDHHFAFEAVSWYWHFVDVVWLFLFVFVYWL